MEDEASSSLDGKVLGNLRVVDLKQELDKRGLSKSGSKKDLVKRLKQQLEFEKLCEEKKTGEFDRKIELDAATEQNEFVKQYLAQQQRRLEEKAQQKHGSEGEFSNENPEDFAKDEDSDSDVEDSETDESSKNTESTETKDEITVNVAENCGPVTLEKTSNSSAVKNVESNKSSSPVIAKNVSPEPKCLESDQMHEAEENQNDTKNLESVIEDNEAVKYIPLPSPNVSEEEIIQDSEKISENQKHTSEDISSASASVSVEEPMDSAALEGNLSHDRHSENTSRENHPVTDCKENSSNLAHSSDLIDQTHPVAPDSNSLKTPVADAMKESQEYTSSQGGSSPKNLCEKDMSNMEPSECSSVSITQKVPYSLSDIQLPESPGHHLKPKDLNNDENCNNTKSSPNIVEDQNSPSNLKGQSNGVSTVDNDNSNEVPVSDNETKENVKNIVSPEKPRARKESVDSRQTDESSEVESEKDVSQNKKSPKHEDSSSNIISDSKEEIVSKETPNKEHKSSKHHHQSYESDKSSDSDKYKHRRADSKHKTHVKHRKRNRRSRSQSSSSSSSRSSDSSSKRRHSKKSVITRSKSHVEKDESNLMSDKNNDEKIDKQRVQDRLTESTSIHSGESSKKRLKIKRDNVVLEVNTPNIESVESTSKSVESTSKSVESTSKSVESTSNSIESTSKSVESTSKSVESTSSKDVETSNLDAHSTVEKPPKEETTEIKLSLSDLPYVPRKVSLSNRKLNRKSSEDKSNEPKPKKNKWESFAACQKASNTISISTDSLKNWFPDFKLISEPSSSMELETDEPSTPATDEKSSSIMHTDVSYRNDAGLKQDSVSQLEMEDSESQEPNFEDSIEQGPVSKIIFIQNLVRPFTLGQLKDLLKQNGNIVEEYFWIDKIKSKCFVMYETEKEAIKAKNALHNARWPLSNPKILTVEFSNFDELELHKKGNEVPPKPVIETPVVETPEEMEPRASYSGDENKRKERERRKEKERSKGMPPVREWDKDKVLQDSPERERIPKEEKSRSSDKKEKKESKKRPNEDTPAKLLDDLFQKTKNPPCIYWLPLTEEQAKQKEEAKKLRKLEREKRNQQLKEQEEAERRSKRARSSRRSREKENRKSSTRSRSPVSRRR